MELMRRRELYVRAKSEKTLSLKEDEFMARRKEMDAQKEAEKEELEVEKTTDVVFRDTYYNREAINVTSDYVIGLRDQNLAKAR